MCSFGSDSPPYILSFTHIQTHTHTHITHIDDTNKLQWLSTALLQFWVFVSSVSHYKSCYCCRIKRFKRYSEKCKAVKSILQINAEKWKKKWWRHLSLSPTISLSLCMWVGGWLCVSPYEKEKENGDNEQAILSKSYFVGFQWALNCNYAVCIAWNVKTRAFYLCVCVVAPDAIRCYV